MSALVPGLPLAFDVQDFIADPLASLATARDMHGDAFAIRTQGPVFSRASDCAGVVCVFGAALQRTVLSDIRAFGMPLSAARHLQLDERLVNLNRGLHSMTGREHDEHKKLLTAMVNVRDTGAEACGEGRTLEDAANEWVAGSELRLLHWLRNLTLRVSSSLLFGEHDDGGATASLVQRYFFLRREVSAPAGARDERALAELTQAGHELDLALRAYVDRCRDAGPAGSGMLAKLATLEPAPGHRWSVDEIVGHLNILFISSTEPLAVALSWTLLVLSQLPNLRRALREEVHAVASSGVPSASDLDRMLLLDRVISESLRVLPPNAFMVRVTGEPVLLGRFALPARCEVILCPYISHRDPGTFDDPEHFRPDRWKLPPPSPFAYFPFGAGGHACIGKALAMRMMKATLAFLLSKYDVVLAGDQDVDWRLHIQFMPNPDPVVVLCSPGSQPSRAPGRLGGTVRDMIRLDDE